MHNWNTVYIKEKNKGYQILKDEKDEKIKEKNKENKEKIIDK